MSQSDHLLTTQEVAAVLSTSIASVKRAALDGRLPVAQKLPGETGAYLFTRAAVDQFAAQRRAS